MQAAQQAKALLEALKPRLPAWIADFETELGEDWTGEPALWVWMIVEDAMTAKDTIPAVLGEVQHQVWEALLKEDPGRWPHVRIRTVSEQKALRSDTTV